jgi:hypothetical protein
LGRICSLCEFGKLFDSLERKGKIEDIIDTFMSIQYLKVVYSSVPNRPVCRLINLGVKIPPT